MKEQALQVFDGVMLSDGGIARPASPWFSMGLSGREHMDWLCYIKDALNTLGVEVCAGHPKVTQAIHKHNNEPYDFCRLSSKSSGFVTEQRRRWYPDGKKEVPEDFTFTPTVLANEVMGDGTSGWAACDHSGGIYVLLCTQSFSLHSIEIVEYELRRVGLTHLSRGHYRAQDGSGIAIRILGGSAPMLMELIEPHILSSYRYKIKKPGSRARSNALQ